MVHFSRSFSKIFGDWQLLRFTSFIIAASTALPFLTQAYGIQNRFVKSNTINNKYMPINISAEQITGTVNQQINLDSNIEIIHGKTVIKADKAEYQVITNEIKATGNIWIQHLQNYYIGDALTINLNTNQGYVLNSKYFLSYNGGHGIANRIDFISSNQIIMSNGTYSTCVDPKKAWYIYASTLDFNKKNDIGIINTGMFYFKNIPIFGVPVISFPLSKQRKLGFSSPTLSITSTNGLELTIPYYLNIVSNQDWIIYPKYIFKRGLHLGLNGHYQGQMHAGKVVLEGIIDQTTQTKRYLFSSIHTHTLTPQLTFNWNLHKISDNEYSSDFSHTVSNSIQRLLTRNASLIYNNLSWKISGRTTKYQLLQDINNLIQKPYDRVLQLTFDIKRKDINGFNINLISELTKFSNVYTVGVNIGHDMLGGYRTYVTSSISYPMIHSGYFITPKVIFDVTAYYFKRIKLSEISSLIRIIPTYSLDTGIIVERETHFLHKNIIQTLEPRLFYVHTPYQNQNHFPNFDSSIADFNFTQIFTENNFIGHDRISDANQITSAIISRFIEKNGLERLRLGIGQIFYFHKPKVTLNNNINPTINHKKSNLLLLLSGQITHEISLNNIMQYNEILRKLVYSNFNVHWQFTPQKTLNVAYRLNYNNNLLKQIDVSSQWPILQHWNFISRINYSIPKKIISGSLFGIEYKNNCWISRLVTQRISTALNKTSTSFLVQFELNGFSKISSNLLDIFNNNISSY